MLRSCLNPRPSSRKAVVSARQLFPLGFQPVNVEPKAIHIGITLNQVSELRQAEVDVFERGGEIGSGHRFLPLLRLTFMAAKKPLSRTPLLMKMPRGRQPARLRSIS